MEPSHVKRTGVFVLVVVVVLVIGSGVSMVEFGQSPGAMANPEFAPDQIVGDRVGAAGDVVPDVPPEHQLGTIVIDAGHENDFDRAAVEPLVSGITAGNNQVRFHRDGEELAADLRGAKGYVIISPGRNYTDTELDTVSRFRSQGGRVVLVAEPDRYRSTFFGVGRVSDAVTEVASSQDVSFSTSYLYNLENNDGTFKQVPVMPGSDSPVAASGPMTVFTATQVTAPYGTDLLVTAPGTRLSDGRGPGQFPVAKRTGNIVAVGDRTLLSTNYYTVGQNEQFLTYLVEFLARGEVAFDPTPAQPPMNTTPTGS